MFFTVHLTETQLYRAGAYSGGRGGRDKGGNRPLPRFLAPSPPRNLFAPQKKGKKTKVPPPRTVILPPPLKPDF